MPHAKASDGIKLHYEEAGSGTPLLFVHEFAGDYRSWEPQMRYFARRYRCITYSQRGYTPSDVPTSPDAYSYEHFRDDVVAVLDHLEIDKAHICGLSMGGYSALLVGLKYPQRALSLTLAGAGSGSERWLTEDFRKHSRAISQELETRGVLFFPLPLAIRADTGERYRDHREPDFLVCDEGTWGVLEVSYHPDRFEKDKEKDAWWKKSGILCVEHYTAERCYREPARLVDEFLEILRRHRR